MVVTRKVYLKYHSPTDGEGNDLGGAGVDAGGESSFVESTPAADDSASDSTETDVNWGGMADELEHDDEVDVEGDSVVVEPENTPAAPAATEPAAAPAPAATEQPPAVTPAPSALTPPPAVQASDAEYGTWRAQRLTQLEQTYALDPESANALLTEPETVLPKLAAQVHMEVMENSMRAMQAMVPVMMQQIQYNTEINSRAKGLFQSVNPDLADPRYEGAILQLGEVYRRVNRTAPPEEAARAIGNLVRAALGIAPSAPTGQPPAVAATQARPAVTPFSPARGAGGGRAPVQSGNMFEQFAAEIEKEDW